MMKTLYYTLLDKILSKRWRKESQQSRINGDVLMYHHITDEFVNVPHSCRCPVKVFEHYLDEYTRRGYRFVSVEEALSIIEKGEDSTPFCVVTFDDIPEDVYRNAYPILKRRNIPFTVFVTTKYVDSVKPETEEIFISREHLLEMDRDALCTVGAHTTTHPMLRNVANAKEEIVDNKVWLEALLGHPVDYLAYPYGKHSSVSTRIQQLAKEAGFKCAFGTIDAPINDGSKTSLFYLPRIVRN